MSTDFNILEIIAGLKGDGQLLADKLTSWLGDGDDQFDQAMRLYARLYAKSIRIEKQKKADATKQQVASSQQTPQQEPEVADTDKEALTEQEQQVITAFESKAAAKWFEAHFSKPPKRQVPSTLYNPPRVNHFYNLSEEKKRPNAAVFCGHRLMSAVRIESLIAMEINIVRNHILLANGRGKDNQVAIQQAAVLTLSNTRKLFAMLTPERQADMMRSICGDSSVVQGKMFSVLLAKNKHVDLTGFVKSLTPEFNQLAMLSRAYALSLIKPAVSVGDGYGLYLKLILLYTEMTYYEITTSLNDKQELAKTVLRICVLMEAQLELAGYAAKKMTGIGNYMFAFVKYNELRLYDMIDQHEVDVFELISMYPALKQSRIYEKVLCYRVSVLEGPGDDIFRKFNKKIAMLTAAIENIKYMQRMIGDNDHKDVVRNMFGYSSVDSTTGKLPVEKSRLMKPDLQHATVKEQLADLVLEKENLQTKLTEYSKQQDQKTVDQNTQLASLTLKAGI